MNGEGVNMATNPCNEGAEGVTEISTYRGLGNWDVYELLENGEKGKYLRTDWRS